MKFSYLPLAKATQMFSKGWKVVCENEQNHFVTMFGKSIKIDLSGVTVIGFDNAIAGAGPEYRRVAVLPLRDEEIQRFVDQQVAFNQGYEARKTAKARK